MKIHPFADKFPDMPSDQYAALEADIEAHGVREPVVVHKGQIIDGKHRWRACHELGVKCPTAEWGGKDDDLWAWIVSKNLHRRHLTEAQRAMIAAEASIPVLARAQEQTPNRRESVADVVRKLPTQKEAAAMMRVSRGSVNRAAAVAKADPEIAKQVREGKVSLASAERKVKDCARAHNQNPNGQASDEKCGLGKSIPPGSKLAAAWAESAEVKEAMRDIQSIRQRIERLASKAIGAFFAPGMDTDLKNVWSALKFALPYTACPACAGSGCKVCRKQGWVPKEVFARCDPANQRAAMERE